jgi:hypothetical protein
LNVTDLVEAPRLPVGMREFGFTPEHSSELRGAKETLIREALFGHP